MSVYRANTIAGLCRFHANRINDFRHGLGAVAEEAFEFAAELRGAFVANLRRGGAGVEAFVHHQHARFVQPHVFHVLQRRPRGHGIEVQVKRGDAHAGFARE